MNNKVKFLRGTATEYEASAKDNDTFYYTTDDEKLYLGNKEITGGGVTVDDALSDTSEHPVQNKVIKAALDTKADLSDIPTTLPANGGNAQALTDYNSTDVRLMLGWRGESLDSTTYLAGYDTSELESNGIVKIKDINADKAYVGNAGNADTVDGKHASDFALKTDIPTTLPANGGNADTVDGKHASDLITHYGLLADSSLDPNTRGCWDANITGNSIGWANVVQFENGHFITQIAFGASTGKTCSLRLRTRYASSEFESWESDWNYIETVQNAITANTAGTPATTASNVCLRNISAGTADLSAGVSELATGAIYLVYE